MSNTGKTAQEKRGKGHYEEKIKFLIEILKKVVDKAGKDLII